MAGRPEAAEDAYGKSLAIRVRLGDIVGQAHTLGQLGVLFGGDQVNRPEEAVAFFRQAADKFVEIHDGAGEGRSRSNLAAALLSLRRLDEARQEIRRAIECDAPFGHAAEPWTTWATLANIENDAGNRSAAEEARRKAIDAYLAYRRDGGENHFADGRLSLAVTEALRSGGPGAAETLLHQIDDTSMPARTGPFVQALQAIVAGSRDRSLADAPGLDYTEAAEILFLIESAASSPA